MRTSDQINEISAALAKAQGVMKNPEKNKRATIPTKTGGGYSYDYADLPSTFDTVRRELSEHGIMHTSAPRFVDGQYILFSRLSHASGQWIEAEWPLPNSIDPKQLAGAITYGTRYLFNSLCGIAGDDDLDSEPEHPSARYESKKVSKPPTGKSVAAPTVEREQQGSSLGHADLSTPAVEDKNAILTYVKIIQANEGRFTLLAKLKESAWPKEHLIKYCTEVFQKADSKSLTHPELTRLVNAATTFKTLEDALKAETK